MSGSEQSHTTINIERSHQCGECDRAFKRAEHLRRHQSVHEHGNKFVCDKCDKRFARSDVLARHSASHEKETSSAMSTRACFRCAQARERCSRIHPCDRCSARGLDCSFPPSRHETASKRSHGTAFAATSPNVIANAPATIDNAASIVHYSAQYMDLSPHQQPPQPPAWLSPHLLETGGTSYDPLQDYNFPMNWLPVDLTTDYPMDGLAINDNFWALSDGPTAADMGQGPREVQGATPGQSSAFSQASASNIETYEEVGLDAVTPGTRYSNSMDGARISSSRRAKLRRHLPVFPGATPLTLSPEALEARRSEGPLQFAELSRVDFGRTNGQPVSSGIAISMAVYSALHQQFMSLCVQPACSTLEPFSSSYFPAIDHLTILLDLYFQHFDPILPFLHKQDEGLSQSCILILAVCTVGCHYTAALELESWKRPFHEFLRRALSLEFDDLRSGGSSMSAIQALLLSHVSMQYGSSPAMAQYAQKRLGLLVELIRENKVLVGSRDGAPADTSDVEMAWVRSRSVESRRRLGYAVWLFDCMSSIHSQRMPLLSIADTQAPLPDDRVWRCCSAEEWSHIDARTRSNQTLQSALETLILEKHVDADLCDFGRLILIHAIYHEVWAVQSYTQRPLSSWTPSAEPDKTLSHPPGENWLLGNATFSSWRNLACDCIDTLHWAANGRIAQLSGIEPPMVFHLHFSRIVLLVPYRQILTMVAYRLRQFHGQEHDEPPPSAADVTSAEQDIARWVQRDEHKSRLAMIHAGCLLWHARRFGAYAFYEPLAIYLAILTIWTYSSMLCEVTPTESGGMKPADRALPHSFTATNGDNSVEDIDSDDQPTFIRLDRPNDDEMVQLFVRKGRPRAMRAHITGIGEVCSPSAKSKTLQEGIKILTTSNASAVVWQRGRWQCGRNLRLLLQALKGNG